MMTAMTDPRRISTTLPRDLHERLTEVAREERRSLASMLAIAVEDWLRQRRREREATREGVE
jgi:predicted transcriptional regulator